MKTLISLLVGATLAVPASGAFIFSSRRAQLHLIASPIQASELGLTSSLAPSIRGERTLLEFLRSQPRPVEFKNYLSFPSVQGFLNPSRQTVFAPIYFFSIWRPVNGSSEDAYSGGEFGAWKINWLPEWAQAALRLTHPRRSEAIPSDVRIYPKEATESDWYSAISQPPHLLKQRLALQKTLARPEETIRKYKLAESLKAQIELLGQRIQDAQDAANQAKNALTTVEEDVEKIIKLRETARSQRWWHAHTIGLFISETPELDQRLKTGIDNERQIGTQTGEAIRHARQLVAEKQVLAERLYSLGPENELLSESQLAAARAKLEDFTKDLEAAHKTILGMEGFVSVEASSLRFVSEACARPYLFVGVRGTFGNKHPFFSEDVESEIVPNGKLHLVVCLDATQHLASVHILAADRREIASSQIERDRDGKITGLVVRDLDGYVIERHEITPLSGSGLRYTIQFPDRVSIYTDVRSQSAE